MITWRTCPKLVLSKGMSKAAEGNTDEAQKQLLTYHRRKRCAGQKRKAESNSDENCDLAKPVEVFEETDDVCRSARYPSCHKKEAQPTLEEDADIYAQIECPTVMETWKNHLGQRRVQAPQRRIIGQYFLDLGQKNFSRIQCSVCGLMYARGQENDEMLHKAFHRRQTQGIQFKGWKTERVVSNVVGRGCRVICVFPDDPPQHQYKVREVVALMEAEMGLVPGWLLEKQCKVYFFISASKKIVGCLMAEPIEEAFVVVPERGHGADSQCQNVSSGSVQEREHLATAQGGRTVPTSQPFAEKNVLVFGNWKLRREVIKRPAPGKLCNGQEGLGAVIMRSKVPVPAVCGVRCMWVSQAERRKGVATHLVDAMRNTFCMSFVLKPEHFAFSQPTQDGRAFALRYCKTDKFLVYG